MAFLTRDAILGADDAAHVDVECPEWGGTVRLRSITGAQRDQFEQSCLLQKGKERRVNMRGARARLIALCAVDEHGGKLFGDDDVAALGRRNAKPLDRLYDAATKLCGLSEDDMDELTSDFEDAAQNEPSTTG
ncbi:hypothetical protein BBK14_11190 [Parafrankia soli]|uniref:Tail assembly chaperone n=1 Tax=Parafrankia soli TaxID=2599596 RepID=A0A1S1R8X3_9ACTN|nr:hypothetical protein [Parafrankia soli]OHV42179.1 hypothetical protein BBK14_11190 [Parafrankia soli]